MQWKQTSERSKRNTRASRLAPRTMRILVCGIARCSRLQEEECSARCMPHALPIPLAQSVHRNRPPIVRLRCACTCSAAAPPSAVARGGGRNATRRNQRGRRERSILRPPEQRLDSSNISTGTRHCIDCCSALQAQRNKAAQYCGTALVQWGGSGGQAAATAVASAHARTLEGCLCTALPATDALHFFE